MKTKFLRDKKGKIDKRYKIAEDGSYIRDKKTGGKLIPQINSQRYRVINIILNGKKYKQIKISHLQWMAWKGIIPKRYEIHHNGKNKDENYDIQNDDIDNLRCWTKSKHMKMHGKEKTGENNNFYKKKHTSKSIALIKEARKKQIGENHPYAKFKNEDIKEIRYLWYIENWTYKEIVEKFKVSYSCIVHIVQGHNWNPEKLTKQELFRIARKNI